MVELVCVGILSVFLLMLLAWFCYLLSNNPSIIDLFWALGFVVLLTVYYLFGDHGSILNQMALALGLLWATRLFLYLFLTRALKRHHDPRYDELSSAWKIKKSLGFLANYFLQGFLLLIISLPFLLMFSSRLAFGWCYCLGGAVAFISIVNEAIADCQLSAFKSSSLSSDKKVCDFGWWKYSRHPNYFFDWLTWLGFAVMVLPSQFGWLAMASPILLLYIFLCLTINITEQHAVISRGKSYRQYQQRTSKFFPWRVK